jgi:hypothetical protein
MQCLEQKLHLELGMSDPINVHLSPQDSLDLDAQNPGHRLGSHSSRAEEREGELGGGEGSDGHSSLPPGRSS